MMRGHRHLSVAECLGIWRRRRKWAALCCLLGAATGYGIARVLPANYASTATVQETKAPLGGDVVLPAPEVTVSRLSSLREQTLTQQRLQGLIERFGLYPEKRNKVSMQELVAEMRRNIALAPSTAGFTISFTAGDARTAQQVCAEIVSLFREEGLKERSQEAAGGSSSFNHAAAEFLAGQVEKAKRKRDQQDARLAAFQRRHAAELAPGYGIAMENSLTGYRTKLDASNAALKHALQDRAALSESILSQQAVALEWRKADTASVQALEQQLATEEAQLVTLEARYTPDHPDVVKLRTDIAQLQKKIEEAKGAASSDTASKIDAASGNEPPQIAQLRAQIHELDLVVQEKTREQARLQQEIQASQAQLDNSTVVEKDYKNLTRESETSRALYDSLLVKQSEALKAAQLEPRQDRSEFLLVEPANLPALPSSPNPIFYTLGGAGSGLVLGMLVVLAGEARDKTLRTEGDIQRYLDLPTLAVIPPAGTPDGNKGDSASGSWRDLGKRGEKEEGVLTDV